MASLLDVAILRAPVPRSPGDGPANTPPKVPHAPASAKAPANAPAARSAAPALDPADVAPTAGANALPPAPPLMPTVATITPDALSTAIERAGLDATDAASNTILRARCDDVARRVVREGGHVSMTALAREVGTAVATLKRLMATPLYRETYNRVSDELLGTIDDRIADERLDTLARSDTLQKRALTVLSEALEIARGHMRSVRDQGVVPRPQLLKVAVDAAAEVRQVVGARAGVDGRTSQVNINITRNHATVIQGAFRESGVDLSDVLDGVFVVPTTSVDKE